MDRHIVLPFLLLLAWPACDRDREPAAEPAAARARTGELEEPARRVVRGEMMTHGEDLENLLWMVLMLDYESAAHTAGELARSPSAVRPLALENQADYDRIPARFVELEGRLREAAGELARAAGARDPNELSSAFGDLAETCVSCHAEYLPAREAER